MSVGQVKLEDSNMANYGSEEHREMKKEAAQKEPAWEGVGNEPGVQVWRIEKFKVAHWPKDRYGEFYSGDSYICLNTKVNDEGKKEYDVFFWLGAETTQDEAGTAAYKTVELDDLLGDEPVQYREVQGNESKGFLSLFTKMTILEGGIETGFHHVKPTEYKPKLLHVTGFKKNVQVYQVPIKAESLNNSDCFVLDAGLKIFQFNGQKSSAWEKRKASAIVDEIKSSRHGKVQDFYVIDGLADKGNKMIEEFWDYFGGRPASIQEEDNPREAPPVEWTMQHISDASGRMETKEVARGKANFKKDLLDSGDAYILDVGTALFVWVGKGANKAEKREAMVNATRYLQEQGRGSDVPICRILEGQETPDFQGIWSGKAPGGKATDAKKWK